MRFALVCVDGCCGGDNGDDADGNYALHGDLQPAFLVQICSDVLTRLDETLCAICDADKNNHIRYEKEMPLVRRYTDLDEMISSEDFNAVVVVCSQAAMPLYAAVVSRLLDAKKYVFLEWPFVCDAAAEYAPLFQLAQKRKVLLDCSRMYVTDTTTVDILRQIISQNRYGRLLALEFSSRGCTMMPPMDHAYGGDYNICRNEKNFTNHMILTSCIYLVNRLFDSVPNMVFARTGTVESVPVQQSLPCDNPENTDDVKSRFYSHVILGYANDATAIISCNNMKTSIPDMQIKAVLENATVVANGITRRVSVHDNASCDIDVLHGKDASYTYHLLCSMQGFIDTIYNHKIKAKKNAQNQSPQYTPRIKDAVASAKISKAALLSSKNGIPIYLDLRYL